MAKERSELCMAWNRTLPINQLPNELLVSIFAQVADAIPASESDPYSKRFYPTVKWIKVLKVCRYWRDVAFASPTLWRAIPMRSPVYVRRALALSTPATVDAFFVKSISNPKNAELLRPHAQRLRSLYFDAEIVGSMSWQPATIALLQIHGGMAALETLELRLGWRWARDPTEKDFVDIRLTPERFPCLRSLSVALVVAPQDIQVYARLRKLSLDTCRCNFSFHHFLDILAASTGLESLVLDSVLQRIQGDWVESISPIQNLLSLRCLKSLRLASHPPIYTSRFLSHVLLSPTVTVRIDGYQERDFTETVSAMLPPDLATHMPAIALAKEVSVDMCQKYSLVCSVEPPGLQGSYLVTLLLHSSAISSHHGARVLLSVFGSAPLITLGFVGDCADVSTETWTEIFTRYPLLETLRLGNAGTTERVFAGLLRAAPTPDLPVPCPRLRSVAVSGTFFEEALEVTLQCLGDRAEKGYRLGEITMELWGDEGEDRFFETSYVPRLRELATEARCVCTYGEWVLKRTEHKLIEDSRWR